MSSPAPDFAALTRRLLDQQASFRVRFREDERAADLALYEGPGRSQREWAERWGCSHYEARCTLDAAYRDREADRRREARAAHAPHNRRTENAPDQPKNADVRTVSAHAPHNTPPPAPAPSSSPIPPPTTPPTPTPPRSLPPRAYVREGPGEPEALDLDAVLDAYRETHDSTWPAVVAWRSVWPRVTLHAHNRLLLHRRVPPGDPDALRRLHETCLDWHASGNNPTNISALLATLARRTDAAAELDRPAEPPRQRFAAAGPRAAPAGAHGRTASGRAGHVSLSSTADAFAEAERILAAGLAGDGRAGVA